jgi:hypothetical protein
MGPLVKSLDLSQSSVHDGVVSLVLSLCSHLQRLDLHKSQITDVSFPLSSLSLFSFTNGKESLLLIAEVARDGLELAWLNLQYTHVSREGVHSFSLCCPHTTIVI